MNESLNIPAILKGKPQGTKLHDLVRCIDVYLSNVDDSNEVHCFEKNRLRVFQYSSKGTLVGFENGMPVLAPSEAMLDWDKFAWRKGDVLVSTDGKCKVIFERFDDDTYTSFVGKYYVECYGKNDELLDYEEEHYGDTVNYTKESKEVAQSYIKAIEKRFGGKLNMETFEIEKAQPEFKNGDIVCISGMGYLAYGIVKSIDNLSKKLEYYVLNDMSTLKIDDWLSFEDKQIQPITETQQIILFDALAKEGKAWDSEHKMIVKQLVPGNLYYFEMENELAYIAKLKKAKGGEFTFDSNVSWCPRNSQNGYDYEEGSFTVSDKNCYGFREANADECKIFEKFLVEQAMKSFNFKALDYVLAKNITCYESNAWNLFQYAYRNKDGVHIMVGGAAFIQCIPYVGNEDLLGTTKSYSTKK